MDREYETLPTDNHYTNDILCSNETKKQLEHLKSDQVILSYVPMKITNMHVTSSKNVVTFPDL